jgi:hypothetical protein
MYKSKYSRTSCITQKAYDPAGVVNEIELICVFNDMSFDIVKTQKSMTVDFRIKVVGSNPTKTTKEL